MKRLIASACVALFALSSAHGQWTSSVNISNTTGRYSVNPTLQVDGNNKVHIVWYDWIGGDKKIYYANNTSGTWVSALLVTGASDPAFAITPDNVLHVFYKSSQIYEITKPASGGSWSAAAQVNHTAANGDKWPRHAAVDANGGLYFTYLHLWDDGAQFPSAQWGRYKPLGGSWSAFEVVKPGPNRDTWPIDVVLFPKGSDMYCTYVMQNKAYYKKRNPAGGSWQADFQIGGTTGIGAPRIAFSPTGEWAVAYQKDSGAAQWFEVYAQFSADSGGSWSTPFVVSNNEDGLQRIPEICYDASGTFHLTYQRYTCDGCSQPEMFYRTKDTSGTWSGLQNLSNTSQRSAGWVQAIRAKGNDLYFVWQDANTSDGFEDVFYKFKPGSAPIPQFDTVNLNTTSLIADGSTQYMATLKVSHGSGVNEIRDMRALFNRNFSTPSANRGYLVWGQTQADVTFYGGTMAVQGAATGGGYWGYDPADWGYQYISPVGCTTSTLGTQRTVTWTFRVQAAWGSAGPATGNFIGLFARDNATTNGWYDSSTLFGYTFNVSNPAPPPGTISGTITSSTGGAVSGATVSTNVGGYTTTTNASGQYTLSNVAVGTYNVTASKTGYISATQNGVVVSSGATTTVNLAITPYGAISGTVTSGGSPLSGATVSTNVGGYNTTTNASGQYTLSNVTPGTYNVTASKSGYNPLTTNGVVVSAGTTTANINFALTAQPGSITGTVTSGGSALSGATVSTNVGGYTTTTNASGQYTLSSVTPGTYNVTASKTGYDPSTTNGVVVNPGATTININFALTAQPGGITGTVTSGGSALSGATVSTNVGGYTTTTNASGQYTLSSVVAGTYNVTASKSGYNPSTTNGVVVNPGATTSGINFALTLIGGGTQVLLNGNMEGGWWATGWGGGSVLPNEWDGWQNPGDFNCFQETNVKHGGANSARTTISAGGNSAGGGFKRGIGQFVTVGANASFTITAWAYHTNGNCPSIMAWNTGQNFDPQVAFNNSHYKWITTDNWGQLNTWVSNTLTGTADATGVITVIIGGAHHGGGGGATVYIDDVSCTVP